MKLLHEEKAVSSGFSFEDLDTTPLQRKLVFNGKVVSIPFLFRLAYGKLNVRKPRPVIDASKIVWGGYWDTSDGYGLSCTTFAKGLLEQGYEVEWRGTGNEYNGIAQMKDEELLRHKENRLDDAEIEMACCLLPDIRMLSLDRSALFAFTMWEATEFPESWKHFVPFIDGFVVPSEFCADAVREAGGINVAKVGLPVLEDIFNPSIPRLTSKEPFKFLFVSTPVRRKGVDILLDAFDIAFSDNPDVRLHLHMRQWPLNPAPEDGEILTRVKQDPRITYSSLSLKAEGIRHLYSTHHCLVHLARSEGFGMTPCQAMGCGLPVICIDAHGCKEFVSDLGNYALPVKVKRWEDCNHPFYTSGQWAIADTLDAARQMRWVYSNYSLACDRAQEGAYKVLERFGESSVKSQLKEKLGWLVEQHNMRLKCCEDSTDAEGQQAEPCLR